MKANGHFKIPPLAHSEVAARIASHSKSKAFSRFGTSDVAAGWMQSASMEMVLPQIKDGIVVCDAQGLIVLANASARELGQQSS